MSPVLGRLWCPRIVRHPRKHLSSAWLACAWAGVTAPVAMGVGAGVATTPIGRWGRGGAAGRVRGVTVMLGAGVGVACHPGCAQAGLDAGVGVGVGVGVTVGCWGVAWMCWARVLIVVTSPARVVSSWVRRSAFVLRLVTLSLTLTVGLSVPTAKCRRQKHVMHSPCQRKTLEICFSSRPFGTEGVNEVRDCVSSFRYDA